MGLQIKNKWDCRENANGTTEEGNRDCSEKDKWDCREKSNGVAELGSSPVAGSASKTIAAPKIPSHPCRIVTWLDVRWSMVGVVATNGWKDRIVVDLRWLVEL